MHWSKIIWNYFLMIAGALLFALGFNLFLRPAGIAPGGLTGIAPVSYTHLDVYKRQVGKFANRANI